MSDESPEQSIILQRLPQVIRAKRESIVEHWLQAVKEEPEIGSIPLPDSERSEQLTELLCIATNIAEGEELNLENRNALVQHGTMRYKQSYTVPLLTREAKLLQASIAECIQRSLDAVEMIYVVPDTIRLMGTIDALWKVAARGFIRHANAEKIAKRRRSRNVPQAKAS